MSDKQRLDVARSNLRTILEMARNLKGHDVAGELLFTLAAEALDALEPPASPERNQT